MVDFSKMLKIDPEQAKQLEEKWFSEALHRAQKRLGRTTAAVTAAFYETDHNMEHAMKNDPKGIEDVMFRVKLWIDENNRWAKDE